MLDFFLTGFVVVYVVMDSSFFNGQVNKNMNGQKFIVCGEREAFLHAAPFLNATQNREHLGMQSRFYTPPPRLKLHGCVVSHMQVLATTLLSVHNVLNTHFAGPIQLKELNFSYLFLRQ